MERILLCLLCLSDWSVSSRPPREYHYVSESMTWTEAQTYCREKYTDLATIKNNGEMDKVKSLVRWDEPSSFVWIGLYMNIQWKWSDGYKGSEPQYTNWENIQDYEPDFGSGLQFCVGVDENGRWWDKICDKRSTSICYTGTQQDPQYTFISEEMSWYDALKNCREKYVDLATVRNSADTWKIQQLGYLLVPGEYSWIGLYRDPGVLWSDGSLVSFQYWAKYANPLGPLSVACGAADLSDSGSWRPKSCKDKNPFVCHSSERSKRVIKLKMELDDPSVDLKDPAKTAGLLRQLQERLKERGVIEVTLEWREQPDGKVFNKEGERPEEESSEEKSPEEERPEEKSPEDKDGENCEPLHGPVLRKDRDNTSLHVVSEAARRDLYIRTMFLLCLSIFICI